ncbi:MAG: FdhF/YdeP family oxidoreductase [Mycobacteriales bacterium]|nr:FdhF/YdeP family oxidoreductase [Mycobacteriales bacterium]
MRDAPRDDVGDADLSVGTPKEWAAGVPGVLHSLGHARDHLGPVRTVRTLLRLNQVDGVDCPGCAWPEGHDRKKAEFCENGVKAVAEEATLRRIPSGFWAEHAVSELAQRSGYWLGQQGRLVEPLLKRAGSDHYEPVDWDTALDVVAEELRALGDPDQASFYTSGRTSNEAAFLYQLLVRAYGTNNLPDCSNMCHESSGLALTETIGIGKGSVTLDDLEQAEVILVMGQNPGTNHPRMLTALQAAKKAGATIVAVNPLPEAGLLRFKDPQKPSGVVGRGTDMADQFLQIRVNGDLALLQAVNKRLVETGAVDERFVAEKTEGYAALVAHLAQVDDDVVRRATGLHDGEIEELVSRLAGAERIVVCWAMGLTQHKNSVATIREVVNLLLLRGAIGKPGAGVCPVRGHSNVQGDRTMGIWEKPPPELLDGLRAEFGFEPPAADGLDTVDTIRALRDGRVRAVVAMGGNFVAATPDSAVTEAAVRSARLTVHVATKLNRSHTVTGEVAVLLPCLGRTERDVQASGEQVVTVEDSMSSVHASRGRLEPASPLLRSEVAIVCGLGERLAPALPWARFRDDYSSIREAIERVVPHCEGYASRSVAPGGYLLPHASRGRQVFATPSGLAQFSVNELVVVEVPPGRLLLQTVRSHDQYNTTIYGLDDRYRGVTGGRRVVFVHPSDVAALGLTDGAMVDLVSEWNDGERTAPGFRVVAYPTARGCAAAYFPETNVLVPLDSTADGSQTPTSKSVVVRLVPA